jgi:tRNA (cmo5U34)-methyltransferase
MALRLRPIPFRMKPTEHFDQKTAPSYDERFRPLRPFLSSVHLAGRLLLTGFPERSRILSVGAGTGEETLALAEAFPGAEFALVEPSESMLSVAREKLTRAGLLDRCQLHLGYLDSLPPGEGFHAALGLFVSHFILDRSERVRFFSGIAARLRPGGVLLHADLALGDRSGDDPFLREFHREALKLCGLSGDVLAAIDTHVSLLRPPQVEGLMQEAGFSSTRQVAQAGLMRTWFSVKA